ncbi:MAG: LysR family transcriptional regulator [Cytobacillus gottheilii]|uniref:LysR family transcriptional regulator n=1 Tax=Cytobacillus gottheilii TaxID=859144 RepID=UPI00346460C3
MDFRDWTILKVLYEQKNITKTATLMHISQPALTKRLQQIEQNFGVQIVHRGRRGVHFTPQGEYLVKCADEMLNKLQDINDHISNMDDKVTGTLRIGSSFLFSRIKLPILLKLFKDKYPDVEFHVVTGWSEQIYQVLVKQDVHIGLIRGDYKWSGGKRLLLHESLLLVSKKEIKMEDLPKLPRIDYKSDTKLKEMISSLHNIYYRNQLTKLYLLSHYISILKLVRRNKKLT